MDRIEDLTCYYLAFLRSLYLVHQNHHWVSRGENFYGNHLLFERIYKTAADNADLAAEKFIGVFGNEVIDLKAQTQMINAILKHFSDGDPVGTSLQAEKKFLELSQKFYDKLKEMDEMTLGMDDMIMAIASEREAAVYLLQQASSDKPKNTRIAARSKLLKKIAKIEQAEKEKYDISALE